jgi:hypothetical protein
MTRQQAICTQKSITLLSNTASIGQNHHDTTQTCIKDTVTQSQKPTSKFTKSQQFKTNPKQKFESSSTTQPESDTVQHQIQTATQQFQNPASINRGRHGSDSRTQQERNCNNNNRGRHQIGLHNQIRIQKPIRNQSHTRTAARHKSNLNRPQPQRYNLSILSGSKTVSFKLVSFWCLFCLFKIKKESKNKKEK